MLVRVGTIDFGIQNMCRVPLITYQTKLREQKNDESHGRVHFKRCQEDMCQEESLSLSEMQPYLKKL